MKKMNYFESGVFFGMRHFFLAKMMEINETYFSFLNRI